MAPYVYTVAMAIVVVTLTGGDVKAMVVALALAINVAYTYAYWQRDTESLFFVMIGIFSFVCWCIAYSVAVLFGWVADPSQF